MPEPQAVLAPLTRAALVLVVTVDSGEDKAARVRSFAADLPGLVRSVGFRDLDAGLSCVVGVGSDVWPRLLASLRRPSCIRSERGPEPAPSAVHAGRPWCFTSGRGRLDVLLRAGAGAHDALARAVRRSTRCRAGVRSTSAISSASSTAWRTRTGQVAAAAAARRGRTTRSSRAAAR